MLRFIGRPVRTVSNRVARHAMAAAERGGLSPDEFSARTGIARGDLLDPAGRIDEVRHRRMSELMADWLPPPPLDRPLFRDFPVLGNLCLNAPSLRAALDDFVAYRALIGEFDLLQWREADGIVQVDYASEFVPAGLVPARINLGVIAQLVRAYDADAPTRFEVEFVAEPPRAGELRDFHGAAARYGCAANRLRFAAPALDARSAQFNARLDGPLHEQADDELRRIRSLHGFAPRVLRYLGERLADAPDDAAPLMQALCDELGISRWTLQRRLQDDGTSYSALEAEARYDAACRLLAGGDASLAEIGERLRFSSQGAFTRFFRRHAGVAPQAWRLRQAPSALQ